MWPVNEFAIKSSLTPDAIARVLATQINRTHNTVDTSKYFTGALSIEGFTIKRFTVNSRALLPAVTGSVAPAPEGSLVKIKMTLPKDQFFFMCFWISAAALACIISIIIFIMNPYNGSPLMLAPFAFLIFGTVFYLIGFWSEARMQQAKLTELLEGAPS